MLGLEEGELDYGSDIASPPASPANVDDTSRQAPNPFPERGAVDTLTALPTTPGMEPDIITNPLDAEQEQILQQMDSAQRRSPIAATQESHADYVFTQPSVEERLRQVAGQPLVSWRIAPEAKTPDELEERRALRERYLVPTIVTQSQYMARLTAQGHNQPVPQMRGIPVMYLSGESPDEEDNAFVRWAHRVRRLSSMTALRASADRADVLLERKLRFEYAKLKARGQLRANFRRRYAAAVPITAGSHRTSVVNPPATTITGDKRPGSQLDPDHGAQKLPRRMDSPAGGVPRTPMSSQTQGTLATSPDTGIDHGGDAVAVSSQHGTVGSLACLATPVAVGVSAADHVNLVQEVNSLRETLGQTQRMNDALQDRVKALETSQTRMEAQLDLLIRIQHPAARPTAVAQVPFGRHGTDPDTA